MGSVVSNDHEKTLAGYPPLVEYLAPLSTSLRSDSFSSRPHCSRRPAPILTSTLLVAWSSIVHVGVTR